MDMITSNGLDPMQMTLADLKEERKVMNWFKREVYRLAELQEYKYETQISKIEEQDPHKENLHKFNKKQITLYEYKRKRVGINNTIASINRFARKAWMLRNLEEALIYFIDEIDDAMEYKKKRPKHNKWLRTTPHPTPYRWSVIRHKYIHMPSPHAQTVDAKRRMLKKYNTLINRNGVVFQWDKRKLMQVAADRGYYSEIAVAYAIEQCMELPKQAVKRLLKEGKFSWGQVLVIGALFEMTPKEFCDTFLLGYFIEQPGGEWRASFDNIDKNGLLSATPATKRPKKKEEAEEEQEQTEENDGTKAE